LCKNSAAGLAKRQKVPYHIAKQDKMKLIHLYKGNNMSDAKYAMFIKAVDKKSLALAAQELCCTPSAVSHGISALETELGLKLKTPATPAGGGQVLFAQFVQPDEITIFTDCLDKAETLGGLLPARAKLQGIILAHELFHAVEEANPDIYTRTEKIELWRKPFSNKSCIVCLSEIAAMAFAKQLLGLDFNPYALDVLLVYPYDAQAACGLYAEICDLMKEE